jgi:hypothetical protein
MGRTVVEPVRVSVWPEEAAALVAWGAVAVAVAGAAVGAAVAAAEAVAGTEFVVPLLVQPATSIDTMSNAARHTVTNTYELRFVFMVFDHQINQS